MTLLEAYGILELCSTSSKDDIRNQYKKLVKLHHPDKGGDTREFIKVQAAYEILRSLDTSGQMESMDIPIPEDLRILINDVVTQFKRQYESAELFCSNQFDKFTQSMYSYIENASRSELRKSNEYFVGVWNTFLTDTFSKFNTDCLELLKKYETWFEKTMDEVFEDIYQKELKSFKRSPRFYFHILSLITIGFLIGFFMWQLPQETENNHLLDIFRGIGMAFSLCALSPITWWFDCNLRKMAPKEINPFDVVPFRLDNGIDFRGSKSLKHGRTGTLVAGAAGFEVVNAFTSGIGGPLLGAAAGLVVGGIADRIMNPTKKIRQKIKEEFEVFANRAKPDMIKHVMEVHQNLLHNVSEDIVHNYENRIKETVLLLSNQ